MSLSVCYILPRLSPHESGVVVGGCANNCISLVSSLRDQGVRIELLTSVSEQNLENLKRLPHAEYVRPLPESGNGLMGKGFAAVRVLRRGLKDLLREKHFDVIHSHSGAYPYAILPLVADGKTSVRLHSLYCPLGANGGIYSRWWERPVAARTLFSRLDRVVAVTDNVRRSIEETGLRPEKIESVAMCVDTRRFFPRKGDKPWRYFRHRSKIVRLLFVGNASKEKGLAELLHAVRILVEKQVPVFLVAALENQSKIKEYSDGYRRVQRLISRLAIERHVRLLGLVDHIEDLYAESDLLVIPWRTSRGPSDHPMVALEAMAMGKCVVATPVGGCPELLQNGTAGILAENFSAAGIASAITLAAHDPLKRKRIQQAALKRAGDFPLRSCAERLVHLYRQLLNNKGIHDVGQRSERG